jgi:hypothetical protein
VSLIPFLRRSRSTIWILTAAIVVVCFATLARRDGWVKLPDGTEVKLAKVHFGNSVEVSSPGLKLYELRNWLGNNIGPDVPDKILGRASWTHGGGVGQNQFVTWIVLAARGKSHVNLIDDIPCEVVLSDGKILTSTFYNCGSDDRMSYFDAFLDVPASQPQFELRVKLQGKDIHFTSKNPAFKSGER